MNSPNILTGTPMKLQTERVLKYGFYLALAALLAAAALGLWQKEARANDGLVRPFESIRSKGMGGVIFTEGFYAENFHGNPARVTANPVWRFQLPDPMVETTGAMLDHLSDLSHMDQILQTLAGTAGQNLHTRVQMSFPTVYVPGEKWSFALGLLTSVQSDISLRNSFQTEGRTIVDADFAVTVGRKLLEEDKLSLGMTLHGWGRSSSTTGFSLVDIIQGNTPDPLKGAATGITPELDLGATYRMPFTLWDFNFDGALAFNNLLTGGTFGMVKIDLNGSGSTNKPIPQPRQVSFGMSAIRAEAWKFTDWVIALEISEIGNSHNDSVFKHIHFGTEAKWGNVVRPRLGINQGYLCAGLGFDLKVFMLELATYGEELGDNAGAREDRRFAARIAFQI
jgi:hypothetical protein